MARLAVILGITAALALAPASSRAGPRADALLALESGAALLADGHPEEALERFDESVRLDPTLAHAHHNRGIALAQLGRLDEAIDALETATELAPDDAYAHLDLALAFYANGDLFWASDEIFAASDIDPDDPTIAYYEGLVLRELGELTAAEAAFGRAAQDPETAARAGYYLGLTLLQRGHRDEALTEFERVVSADYGEADAPFVSAAGEATDRLRRDEWDIPPLVSGFLVLGALYDTNVILEPDGVARPLGAKSPGLSIWGSLTLAPLRTAAHLLSGSLTAAHTAYFADLPEQFSTTFFAGLLRYRYRFLLRDLTHALTVAAGYDVLFLNGGALTDESSFYAYSEGFIGSLRYDVDRNEGFRFVTELLFRNRIFADMRRDGQSYRLRLGPTFFFLSGRLKLMLAGVFRYDNASGRGFDLWGVGLTTGISALIPWELEVRGLAGYTHHDHFDSQFYSGWGEGRVDDIFLFNLGVRRTLWKALSADLAWTHTTHLSTTPAYDYDRDLVVFSLIVSLP